MIEGLQARWLQEVSAEARKGYEETRPWRQSVSQQQRTSAAELRNANNETAVGEGGGEG